MAQLHFYIPDSIADKIRIKTEHAHLSVSKYLAKQAVREVTNEWPEDFFDKLGKWKDETLQRPSQGTLDQRETLD